MKISENFELAELVPPQILRAYGDKSIRFIDPKLPGLIEFIKWFFDGNSMTINNYLWGGKLKNRGYRTPQNKTGAYYSQHKFGRAVDFNIKGYTPDQIRKTILDNHTLFMNRGLTTIEHGDYAPTWVHVDMRWTGLGDILIVKP